MNSPQQAIDFAAAATARDRGIDSSLEHANKEEPEWSGQALGMLTAFASKVGRAFIIEEARAWAQQHGLPAPPDERAWGGVVRRAANKKRPVIRRTGGTAMAASSHCSPKPLWEYVR